MMRRSINVFGFALFILVHFILGVVSQPATAQGSWVTLTSMPTARSVPGAVVGADGRIYVIGGSVLYSNLTTAEAYDPDANTWSTLASMPTARRGLGVALGPDGRIYAIGGINGASSLNTVEAYDPSANTWSTMASMPTSRCYFGLAPGRDGRFYVIGGTVNGSEHLNTVEAYDPRKNIWTTLAPMPTGRDGLYAATGIDGRIYAMGGLINNPQSSIGTVEAYDPRKNTWTTVTSMPISCQSAGATVGPDDLIYVLGGATGTANSSFISTAQTYNSITDTWSTSAPLPTPRADLTAVTGRDGRIYAIGGGDTNQTPLNLVQAYNPIVVSKLTLSPTLVVGCRNATGVITLNAPVASYQTVTLTSDDPAVTVPTSVIVKPGKMSASFKITTSPVATTQTCTVTAAFGGVSTSAQLNVRPISVHTLTLVPNLVKTGNSVIGVVALDCPAPNGGVMVMLSSSNPLIAFPTTQSILVPAGAQSTTFDITTGLVTSSHTVTITAGANGISKSAKLTVTP